MGSLRGALLSSLLFGVALLASASSHAASISGPSSSTTGTFTLTWTSGYYLHLSDVYYVVSGPPSTSYNFSNLPSGTYKYELWACYTSYETELGYLTWCDVE
jgi:hypothetical protein